MLHLFDNLSSSFLSIMLCYHGGETVHIQSVLSDRQEKTGLDQFESTVPEKINNKKNLPAELVVCAFNKLEFI